MKKNMAKALGAVLTLVLSLSLFAGMNVRAEDRFYVCDGAELMSLDEQETLNSRLEEMSNRLNFNIAVLTATSLGEKSPMAYADDFYDERFGPNTDGVVFLRYISDYDRKLWISTSGIGIICIYDDYIDYIFDCIDQYIDDARYYELFNTYADLVEDTVSLYNDTGSPVDIWNNSGKTEYYDEDSDKYFVYKGDGSRDYSISYNWLDWIRVFLGKCVGPLIVSFFIALGITGSWKKKLNSVAAANSAKNYEKSGSFVLSRNTDTYLRSSVSKVRIESSSSSGGGGGHSSSSHHSSGGGSHGGGGRSR